MKKEDLKDLIEFFSQTQNISKIKLKQDGLELELQKGFCDSNATQHTTLNTHGPSNTHEDTNNHEISNIIPTKQENISNSPCITSPMVGTFYQAPSPDSAPFVKIGDHITKGQTIAIIEAMKIMNEIEAEYDCKITKILLEDGEPVEFDMPLFEVEKI